MPAFLYHFILFNLLFFVHTIFANSVPDSNTTVRINMNVALADGTSSFEIELFDQSGSDAVRTTPKTVANFLSYVEEGLYNGTIFHRLVPGFVLQGGGYTQPSVSQFQAGGVPLPVEKYAPVINEPGNLNVAGTLAMAKLSGDPDSATSGWFINLVDNPDLDTQNSGFTVFGRVISGMELINQIAASNLYSLSGVFYYNPPFTDLPLQGTLESIVLNDQQYTLLQPFNYIAIESVEILNRKSGQLKVLQSEDFSSWSEVKTINLQNLNPDTVFLKSELTLED